MRHRPIYSRSGWVLGECQSCKRTNYVEPHGTTAKCRCSAEWTEHRDIPSEHRTGGGQLFAVTDNKGRLLQRPVS